MPAIHLLISALYMRVCILFVLFLFAYLSYFRFLFSFFFLPYLSLTFQYMDPLRFQARGRKRRPNLGLVCLC